ncbi:Fip1 domain-containing protein [Cephalotus follicularis]|uniref:Fip1 domain-containing protein n=1 Tax=Cephalotus follicularis TaxID=3775 RepID=A0A1Q3DEE7_CEPFO|nr:Fip1 domain-containing protein [Cephalotus follicularis]
MEDDDEFGDLYTDVLKPFTASSSSSSAPVLHKLSPTPSPIHLILHSDPLPLPPAPDSDPNSHLASAPPPPRVSTSNDVVKDEVNFDIEEEEEEGAHTGIDHMITDLSAAEDSSRRKDNVTEDWESDSDDDLQIVLNDNDHGTMIERRGAMDGEDDDDDDDDGTPLVILGDGGPNQGLGEEQDWGEDVGQAPDGERKEGAEATAGPGKANGGAGGGGGGGLVIAPKIGYSNHGFHPFHSQYKYVRPGATPIPGATIVNPGGAPGQVRPLVNMGPMAGRGRGDWRPPGIKGALQMQKGYPGFGVPAWGSSVAGRGFGGGLEFTLPSHKNIFDVDIDSFEEKPWKYPGVDVSDFFNFGLNEESWKDYCKQLEQHRLETTMQSKIRVYESGRTEQDFDPDLPPELAAAAGIQDVPADNFNLGKSDVVQSDVPKGSARVRPSLPTGRAIQVETGSGERLPSIDTRPPRVRDSDAIIEIVLQDSMDDDSSTGNGVKERGDSDLPRDDLKGDNITEDHVALVVDTEHSDGFQEPYDSPSRELGGRRTPFMDSDHDEIPEGGRILPFPPEAPLEYLPGSRKQSLAHPRGNFRAPHDERGTQKQARDRSPRLTSIRSKQDKKFIDNDNQEEGSYESMDDKHSPPLSSPLTVRDDRELSFEQKDAVPEDVVHADRSSEMDKEEITTKDTPKDVNLLHSVKKQMISSQVEQPVVQEIDDGEDSKAARSSENSKARSGSSRDYQKFRDGVEEEVVQDGSFSRMGSTRKQLDEIEQNFRRKDRDGRREMERNHMVLKGRDDSFPYRDMDSSLTHHSHMKSEGFDRRKDRINPDVAWQIGNDDPYSRKSRTEDMRKRERGDDLGSRHRGKLRESERSDKDEHVYPRKQLDNGSYRVHYEKDVGSRQRERDDNLKSRFELVDDYLSKRRKDEEHLRSDHAEKEEIFHVHRETTSHRKRERNDPLELQRGDDQQRVRDNIDDHHSVRQKDEAWLMRERNERQREREDWHRPKQTREEILPKREREGRVAGRSGRSAEDKAWVGHAGVKDEYKGSEKEYQHKETTRHSEQMKRRDRVDDESSSHHRGREDVHIRGNQYSNEERKSRQERSGARNVRAVNASDNQRVLEKKHKESTRKNKESEDGDNNSLVSSRKNQDDQSGNINEMGLKGTSEQGNGENKILVHRNSARKHREEASSDDELHDSRRGRSKLERWTSHKERDYSINSKSSIPLKFKEIDRNNNGGSSETSKRPDEPAKATEAVDNQHTLADEKDATDLEIKDADTRPLEDRHMDTVEKLKKRSERFKLPMPIEKDPSAIKKIESEALPAAKRESPADSEIKPERPARKRRWISN